MLMNYYRCPNPLCQHEWQDLYEHQVNMECGECGTPDIQPFDSKDIPPAKKGHGTRKTPAALFVNFFECPECKYQWENTGGRDEPEHCANINCGTRHIAPYESRYVGPPTKNPDGSSKGVLAAHMQAMEGMLQSCIDRGVIDKDSATAAVKRSKELRKRLG